jgi:nicotinamidase-related amidase
MTRALVVIDLQLDYFPGGNYPLWNADGTLQNVLAAVGRARAAGVPVVLVQHVADDSKGPAPFFNPGSDGVRLHPELLAAAPGAPVVVKHAADGFHQTELASVLSELGATELLVCGMMTQNCVTHTAISKAAENYAVTVLTDCCTTVDRMLHLIALNALSIRVGLATAAEAL